MPINDMFIDKSINLHLFYMRITAEHLIIIESSLPPKNSDLIKESNSLKEEALKFLSLIITIAKGHVNPNVIKSQELITPYTYQAERITEFLTGIKIDTSITQEEQVLLMSRNTMYRQLLNEEIIKLNNQSIDIVKKITDFQTRLYESVLRCKTFLAVYPDRLEHIIDENKDYLNSIQKLQNMNINPTLDSLREDIIFWNKNISDHNEFTAGLLDPHEKESIKVAKEYEEIYEALEEEAINAKDNPERILEVLNKSLETTLRFRDINFKELENMLSCNVKSITVPLAVDHDLREVNYYLRILLESRNMFVSNI